MTTQRWMTMLMFSALLVACGGTPSKSPERPEWVDGRSTRYPPELYLTGRGQSKSSDDAKDRARADLAKIFEVQIREDQKDIQAFSSVQKGDKPADTQSQQSVSRTIVTTTDQIVRGVQIGELWRDSVTQDQYALAILPRTQAAASLRTEIARLDDATKLNIDAAANTTDALDRIARAHHALNAQVERLAFQRSLQVVENSGEGVRPVWSLAQLQNDFEKLLKRLRIRVAITNDDSGQLKDVLTAAVANAGFTADDSSSADYTLESALTLQDLGQKSDDWYWSTGAVEIKLVEPAGKTRGGKRWPIKSSAQQKPMVNQRIKVDLAALLDKELRGTIIGFATAAK